MEDAGNQGSEYSPGYGEDLDARLLEAHERDDIIALIGLYTLAGDWREANNDVEGACFYLTHAYVFSLEMGAPETDTLNRRLSEYGREVRQTF